MSELTKKISRCIIISAGGFLDCGKSSQSDRFAVVTNVHLPQFTFDTPTDSLETASVVTRLVSISHILALRAWTKIRTAIVKPISVNVVSFQKARNFCVHCPAATTANGIPELTLPDRTPIPLGEPLKISGIHDGVLSASQWDQAVRFIKRLDNRVAFHAAFHGVLRQGLCEVQPLFYHG